MRWEVRGGEGDSIQEVLYMCVKLSQNDFNFKKKENKEG